ncbi:MAG TPA: FeoA family protein [Steroidobacteraceae bacterium]|nr:FeoA family protein [Steroidobacteraceae bacterium]
MTSATASCRLDELNDAQEATVVAVRSQENAMPPELLRRLIEIGFLPGERVRIIARGVPGGTPLAVRVGTSTFALRRAEARCVYVEPDSAETRV